MAQRNAQRKQLIQKVGKWGTGLVLGAQLSAIGSIIAIDETRKRRNPPPEIEEFPHAKPQTVTVDDSEITIYTCGNDLYKAQLEAIQNAKDYIYFETFIIKADALGYRYQEELIKAAQRGVAVYLIFDSWGNLNQTAKITMYPNLPNLHVINFPLIRPGLVTREAQKKGRDHRKTLCVDGNIAFVGGYNIGELYAKHWRDTHIRIVGAPAGEIENIFIGMWNMYRDTRTQPAITESGVKNWSSQLRAHANTPAFNSFPIRALYLETINKATDKVWITMAYFIPDEGLQFSLTQAAKRGVDVRILVPEYSNHIIADWVGRPHYSTLLRSGVRIFRYHGTMIHAKTMTADSKWTTVGTMNIDRLSTAGNFEINAEIFSHAMAQTMEKIYELDLSNASELTLQEWEKRSKIARVGEKLLEPLSPLL